MRRENIIDRTINADELAHLLIFHYYDYKMDANERGQHLFKRAVCELSKMLLLRNFYVIVGSNYLLEETITGV